MAYLFIYLIQISDIIVTICIISSLLSFFAGFFYIMTVCEDSLFNNNTIKLAKTAFFITITVAIITGFFPSRQTLLLSGVTYYGSKVYKNIVTNEAVSKVNTIINLELDKQIKNLREEIK